MLTSEKEAKEEEPEGREMVEGQREAKKEKAWRSAKAAWQFQDTSVGLKK